MVYEEREKRSFIRLNLVSLAFTVGGIAALLLMVGAVVAFPLALDHLGLAAREQADRRLARWPVLFVILLAALAVLYRFGPSRDAARWQWLSIGAVTAALLWIAGSALLSWYLSDFANYNATYGSLGAAIGLMMWMWMSAIIVLFGAELNSEIEQQTAAGYHHRAAQAARHPRRRHRPTRSGRRGSRPEPKDHYPLESTMMLRSLRLGEHESGPCLKRSRVFPGEAVRT